MEQEIQVRNFSIVTFRPALPCIHKHIERGITSLNMFMDAWKSDINITLLPSYSTWKVTFTGIARNFP